MDAPDTVTPAAWVPADDDGTLRIYRAEPTAAKAARDFAGECLTAHGRADLRERAEEVISELATNAIRHAPLGGMFAVRFARSGHTYVFDVIDRHPDACPKVRDAGELDEGGRGLILVEALTDAWVFFTRPIDGLASVKVVRAAFR
jgi:anti-sigma regulatory factor (Ser/Thr protein kinase)